MKKIRLARFARDELRSARNWYAALGPELAARFIAEVREARRLIGENPAAWKPLGEGVRQIRLKRFPYLLIYVEEEKEIVVYAVAHERREPNYWKPRRKN